MLLLIAREENQVWELLQMEHEERYQDSRV